MIASENINEKIKIRSNYLFSKITQTILSMKIQVMWLSFAI